jgi:DNA-binding MarR family transcriptional regulator
MVADASRGRVRVDGSLSFLLNKLAQLAGRKMGEALEPMRIQPRESGILAAIAQFGPLSQQRIGELLVIDRTTMVVCVDRLEELGLVERTVHPEDRRVFLIALTDRGRAAVPEARQRLEAFEAELLAPLRSGERKAFRQYVYRLVEVSLPAPVRTRSKRGQP